MNKVLTSILLICCSVSLLFSQPLSLIAPRNEPFVLVNQAVPFHWNKAQQASSYQLRITYDSAGISKQVTYSNLLDPNTTFTPLAEAIYHCTITAIHNSVPFDSTHTFFTATDPLANPNLYLWLDPAKGITADAAQNISNWENQITANYSAVQSNNARKPKLIDSVLNHLPLISFDGNDGLTIPAFPMGTFTLIQFWQNIGGNAVIYEHSPNTNQNSGGYLFTSNLCSFGAKRGSTFSTKDLNAGWGEKNEYIVSTHSFAGTHASNQLLINGLNTNAGTCVFDGNPGLNVAVENLYLGSRNNSSLFMRGLMGDQMAFNIALTDSLRNVYEQLIMDKYAPPVSLGADTIIDYSVCGLQLNANAQFTNCNWSTGDNTSTITAIEPGTYWLEATDIFGRITRDSILVTSPVYQLPDTSFCVGSTITWDTKLDANNYQFQWSSGNTSPVEVISTSNIYQVTITDTFGCQLSLGAAVTIDSFSTKATLGPDTSLCAGEIVALQGLSTTPVSQFLWSTGDTTSSITITQSGDYSVTATNANGCELRDTVNISILSGGLPEPDFTSSSLCALDSIRFTDLSLPPSGAAITSWNWDFGDNASSTLTNPSHQFADSGYYNITLNVATSDGCSKSLTRQVFVHPPPLVNFTVADGGCHASPTVFQDVSEVFAGTMAHWQWDFGDGQTDTVANPSVTYPQPGNYNIQLVGTSNYGCTDSVSKNQLILGSPLAGFTFDPACSGSLTQFYDTSNTDFSSPINAWAWDFGDNTTSNVQDPAHLYLNPGLYAVSLQVTATNGCATDTSTTVRVYRTPEAAFSPDSVCLGIPFTFVDASNAFGQQIVAWQWSFGDGNTDTVADPAYTYTELGTYNVQLRVENGVQCTDSVTMPVAVFPLPTADFEAQPNFGAAPIDIRLANRSQGDVASQWLITDSLGNTIATLSDDSPRFTFEDNGRYGVQLVSTNQYNCTDTVYKDIFIAVPILDLQMEQLLVDQVILPDGSYRVSLTAQLRNVGTRVITNFDVEASLDNGTLVSETWEGLLNPGQGVVVPLRTEFIVQDISKEAFVCVTAKRINDLEPDDNPADNVRCATLEDIIQVSDPYPNPAQNKLTFDVILPTSQQLSMAVFGDNGQQVFTLFEGAGQRGLNRFEQDISSLAQGTYVLRLSYNSEVYTKKFVVQR